jgi:hypothetical protein
MQYHCENYTAKADNGEEWACHLQYDGTLYIYGDPQKCFWETNNPNVNPIHCPHYKLVPDGYCSVVAFELCDNCVDGACFDLQKPN